MVILTALTLALIVIAVGVITMLLLLDGSAVFLELIARSLEESSTS